MCAFVGLNNNVMMLICVLVTIMSVTSHLSVPKFMDRLPRTDFNNGWKLYVLGNTEIYIP